MKIFKEDNYNECLYDNLKDFLTLNPDCANKFTEECE